MRNTIEIVMELKLMSARYLEIKAMPGGGVQRQQMEYDEWYGPVEEQDLAIRAIELLPELIAKIEQLEEYAKDYGPFTEDEGEAA